MAGTVVADKWQNGDGTENYKCRAWVNFNGTGTVAIRASGNVSSITDNGTGDYTVNFSTAMSDTNYSISGSVSRVGSAVDDFRWQTKSTSSFRGQTMYTSTGALNDTDVDLAIFR